MAFSACATQIPATKAIVMFTVRERIAIVPVTRYESVFNPYFAISMAAKTRRAAKNPPDTSPSMAGLAKKNARIRRIIPA